MAANLKCGCCEQCLAALPDHWLMDLWRYCPHNRTMSRRRRRGDAWTIDRNVSPRKASKRLAAMHKLMQAYARDLGTDLALLDQAFTRLRVADAISKADSAPG